MENSTLRSNKLMTLKVDIYFGLSVKQRERLNGMGYCKMFLSHIPMQDFESITKNKRLRSMFRRFKFGHGLKLIQGGK